MLDDYIIKIEIDRERERKRQIEEEGRRIQLPLPEYEPQQNRENKVEDQAKIVRQIDP